MHPPLAGARETILAGGDISRDEALSLLRISLDDLLFEARSLRREFQGDEVELCAIVNARSGMCGEDCVFCAQSSRPGTVAITYPLMPPEGIVERARAARRMNARRFGIVTSGRSLAAQEIEGVCEAVRAVRGMGLPHPCASLGALDEDGAARLREAGLARYHHNLETSERHFPSLCTTHTWRDRVRTVRAAQAAGLEVCSGGIFGGGESWEDRIDLLLALRTLGVRAVPLNFLMPIAGTPLGGAGRRRRRRH